jgi:hypothetical protein
MGNDFNISAFFGITKADTAMKTPAEYNTDYNMGVTDMSSFTLYNFASNTLFTSIDAAGSAWDSGVEKSPVAGWRAFIGKAYIDTAEKTNQGGTATFSAEQGNKWLYVVELENQPDLVSLVFNASMQVCLSGKLPVAYAKTTMTNDATGQEIATDTAVNAKKQDKITAIGSANLLTAPAVAGGQPGTIPVSDFDVSGAAAAVTEALSTHTGNTDIHVTAAQKTTWSGKQNPIAANTQAGAVMTPPTTAGGAPGVMLPGTVAGTYAAGNDLRFNPQLWEKDKEIQLGGNLYGYSSEFVIPTVIPAKSLGNFQLSHTFECSRIVDYCVDCGYSILLSITSILSDSTMSWPYLNYARTHTSDVPVGTRIVYWALYIKN